MKITRELLERYELDQCTDQEQIAVRRWLDSPHLELEDSNLEDEAHDDQTTDEAIELELWQHIAAHIEEPASRIQQPDLPEDTNFVAISPCNKRAKYPKWIAIAASTVVLLGIGWWLYPTAADEGHFFNASNPDHGILLWEEESFEFTLSKNSSASINLQSGNMTVSGDVLFSPKRDIKLYDTHNNTSLDFRQGEVYFISTDPDTSEMVVYSKSQLEYLPPILRKHIRKQFDLT